GIARINLYKRHPHSLKIVHLAPTVFTIGVVLILGLSLFLSPYFLLLLLAHAIFILLDATIRNKSILIGLLAVVASYVQLLGYGNGFLHAFFARVVFRREEFPMFHKSFYK